MIARFDHRTLLALAALAVVRLLPCARSRGAEYRGYRVASP
jgi:hypothetical protein